MVAVNARTRTAPPRATVSVVSASSQRALRVQIDYRKDQRLMNSSQDVAAFAVPSTAEDLEAGRTSLLSVELEAGDVGDHAEGWGRGPKGL